MNNNNRPLLESQNSFLLEESKIQIDVIGTPDSKSDLRVVRDNIGDQNN
jgi:hypothetical protein